MKRIIVAAALLLAACSKSPAPAQAAEAEQPLPAGGEDLYRIYVSEGHSPKEAKDMVIAMAQPTEADEKRAAAHQAERDKAEADIRASACKNDPGISYC